MRDLQGGNGNPIRTLAYLFKLDSKTNLYKPLSLESLTDFQSSDSRSSRMHRKN